MLLPPTTLLLQQLQPALLPPSPIEWTENAEKEYRLPHPSDPLSPQPLEGRDIGGVTVHPQVEAYDDDEADDALFTAEADSPCFPPMLRGFPAAEVGSLRERVSAGTWCDL